MKIAQIFARAAIWLSRRGSRAPLALPMWLQARMTSLGMIARNGGPGSDLAAAELKGMQTVILAVRRTA